MFLISSQPEQKMESVFDPIESVQPEEVFIVRTSYMRDENENKVDLGVGAYRTDEGKPWVLPPVRKVELDIVTDPELDHEYLMFRGINTLNIAATELLLGKESPALREERAFGMQSISGTGALKLSVEFLKKVTKHKTIFVSTPTWDNHVNVFRSSGFDDIRKYRYWDAAKRGLDFDGLIADLSDAPENSVVLLQTCAHNPTGCDPTRQQWTKIADIIEERKLFPLLDAAYQGFASGDLDEDAWVPRYFEKRGFEFFCAQSFSKSLGLYGERIGNLAVVGKNKDALNKVKVHMDYIIRQIYQTPPAHGGRVVNAILHNPQLIEEWKECLIVMKDRVKGMRQGLKERLQSLGTPGNWDHITEQIGMFSFTGLTGAQVTYLRDKWHIYIMSNGRTNICGITSKNIDYVARAIHDAVLSVQD